MGFVFLKRLLVRRDSLEEFEAVLPTSDAWPDYIVEGARIRGSVFHLKSRLKFSCPSDLTSNLLGFNIKSCKESSATAAAPTAATAIDSVSCRRHDVKCGEAIRLADSETLTSPDTGPAYDRLPCNHPLRLIRELSLSPVTRHLMQDGGRSFPLLAYTPIFLTETPTHNACWLARTNPSVEVTVEVELLAPCEATLHWFSSRCVRCCSLCVCVCD